MPEANVQASRTAEICARCPHACSDIFAGLSEAARQELISLVRPMEFESGGMVFREGMPAFGMYILCRGKVKLAKRTRAGHSQILKLLGPGEILGEKTMFDQETYTCYAKTLEPSLLGFIPREGFLQFLRRHPTVALQLIARLSRESKVFGDRLVEITSRSARERVARALVELAQAFGETTDAGWDIGVELPRGELAEMAGVSTETAIRVLSEFKDRGLVALPGRRVVILKPDEMRALAHPFRTFVRENPP
ncbi:MAG: Transcriptional regulator, Crp/Fnr family [Candidatus Bipolaricaulis sibiricus]|uniref:Transcriptional regulator, Crp/Fnr family n=1 Tax=Bipolaricaulis sibiricus TaxID=2501609 RepID=A0A410FWB0_BIPS1|nr:MAG: Transcriptional regulator, Crp/Fnr family [Candidatus Bipolaricaulis sibiricus]